MSLIQLASFDPGHEGTGGQKLVHDISVTIKRREHCQLLTSGYKGGRPAAAVGSMLTDAADNKSIS
jgi:hypothetical protein